MLSCHCITLRQVFQPWIQVRTLDYVKHMCVLTGFLKHLLKNHPLDRSRNPDGSPNREPIDNLVSHFLFLLASENYILVKFIYILL